MLAIQFDLFVVGSMPYGISAVFVHVGLDCLNDLTARPIPSGTGQMVAPIYLDKYPEKLFFCCQSNLVSTTLTRLSKSISPNVATGT